MDEIAQRSVPKNYTCHERATDNRTYVICASPRTGSTLLCSGLIRTGVAGRPRENFDDRLEVDASYKERLNVEGDIAYLAKVLRVSQSPGGVRGLKIHWHQLGVLERMLRATHEERRKALPELSFAELQRGLFGSVDWIWLRRRDKVAQAISLYRASRSKIWHHPVAVERKVGDDSLPYDFEQIDRLVHSCFDYDVNWSKYLDGFGIRRFTLWYEDFIGDYNGSMREVLNFLGIPDAKVPPPGLHRMSGSQTSEWIERFYAEKAAHVLNGNACHRLPVMLVE